MKRTWVVIGLLTLTLALAMSGSVRLIRMTIINKSGLDVEIELTGSCEENTDYYHYYLRVSEGDRRSPTEMVFTVFPDIYKMSVYYVELWDPVYGTDCSSRSQTVDATHNVKVVVSECTWTPPNAGEPSMLKLGGAGTRRVR